MKNLADEIRRGRFDAGRVTVPVARGWTTALDAVVHYSGTFGRSAVFRAAYRMVRYTIFDFASRYTVMSRRLA